MHPWGSAGMRPQLRPLEVHVQRDRFALRMRSPCGAGSKLDRVWSSGCRGADTADLCGFASAAVVLHTVSDPKVPLSVRRLWAFPDD